MFQTLQHIPNELFGLPMFGFGLLLAIWAIASLGFLGWLTWKQGFNDDTRGYLPVLLLVGVAIAWVLPRVTDAEGLPIRGYGVLLLVAIGSAVALAAWRAKRLGIHPELVYTLAFWLCLPGIVGARAFYVIQKWEGEFWPSYQSGGLGSLAGSILNVAQGGLVVYGSLIGAVLGLVLFLRRQRLPLWATLDLVAPSFMLGLAIGRIGCLMNGCCFGGACGLPWAVTFPWSSPPHVRQIEEGRAFLHGLNLVETDEGGIRGVSVVAVEPGSAAEKSGMRPGNKIRTINGQPVNTLDHAWGVLLWAHKPALEFADIQRQQGLTWTLEHPAQQAVEAKGGFALEGATFGESPTGGPVVLAVHPYSAAARAGVQPEMRLRAINGRPVRSSGEATELLAEQATRPWVRVETEGSPQTKRWVIDLPLARSLPVHPTQVYATITGSVICLFLLAIAPYCRRDGELFALMITLYPLGRLLEESIRRDERREYCRWLLDPLLGTGLTISQLVSVLLLLGAAILWAWLLRQPYGSVLPKPSSAPQRDSHQGQPG